MKKLFFLLLIPASLSLYAENSSRLKDPGIATKDSYVNETYKISLKLPEGMWKTMRDSVELINTNGKAVEYWNIEKNIRIVIAVEESGLRAMETAEKNLADLAMVFNRVKVIEDRKFFKKGKSTVYMQIVEADNLSGEKMKFENYVFMNKDKPALKISLFILSPLKNYYDNRTILSEILNNFDIK